MSPSTAISPEDLPFETAPELVERYLDELGIESEEAREKAIELATKYGLEDTIGLRPSSIASAAIYIATWFHLDTRRFTQDEVADVAGTRAKTIGRAYRRILVAEGVLEEDDLLYIDRDEPGDPTRRKLTEKFWRYCS